MIKDSLIWKLTADVANPCAQSCLYPVLLPQACNVLIWSSLSSILFSLNLFSIHSPTISLHSCLCTSLWLFPIFSIDIFPLLFLFPCFWLSIFISDSLGNFSVYLSSAVSYTCSPSISVPPTLPWPLTVSATQLLSFCVISSSKSAYSPSPKLSSWTLITVPGTSKWPALPHKPDMAWCFPVSLNYSGNLTENYLVSQPGRVRFYIPFGKLDPFL